VTIGATLARVRRALAGATETPTLDATRIVEHVLERDRAWLVAHDGNPVPAPLAERADALAARRRSGEPLAYVIGCAWFYGRPFAVGPDVLVPRPETELVVEAALDDLRARAARGILRPRACDVGTGSGAIGITLAAESPDLAVVLSDVSAGALAVARGNAQRLGVQGRVRFVEGDLAEPLVPFGPYDCVVANLPYIPSAEVPAAPNPVGFEPHVALDGGDDGLGLYRRFVRALPRLLAAGGSAFLEAAPGTIEPLAVLVEALPGAHVEIGEDYAGMDRWVALTL
jgi:release factor glutamine methyltransferase